MQGLLDLPASSCVCPVISAVLSFICAMMQLLWSYSDWDHSLLQVVKRLSVKLHVSVWFLDETSYCILTVP